MGRERYWKYKRYTSNVEFRLCGDRDRTYQSCSDVNEAELSFPGETKFNYNITETNVKKVITPDINTIISSAIPAENNASQNDGSVDTNESDNRNTSRKLLFRQELLNQIKVNQ